MDSAYGAAQIWCLKLDDDLVALSEAQDAGSKHATSSTNDRKVSKQITLFADFLNE